MNKNIYAIVLIGFQAIIASNDTSIIFIATNKNSHPQQEMLSQKALEKNEKTAKSKRFYNDSDDDTEITMPVHGDDISLDQKRNDTSLDQQRKLLKQLRAANYQKHRMFLDTNKDQATIEQLLPISFDLLGKLDLPFSLTVDQINSTKKYLQDTKKIPLAMQSTVLGEFQILEELSEKNALPSQVSPELFVKAFNRFFGSGK